VVDVHGLNGIPGFAYNILGQQHLRRWPGRV
jgi:hypothetical protein